MYSFMALAIDSTAPAVAINILAYLRDFDGCRFLVEISPSMVYFFAAPSDGYAVRDFGNDKEQATMVASSHGYRPIQKARAFLGHERFVQWTEEQKKLGWVEFN